MPFNTSKTQEPCPICGEPANILERDMRVAITVDCSRCSDYRFESREVSEDSELPIRSPERWALVSYLIRQMNGVLLPTTSGRINRPVLTREFFQSLNHRSLPSAEDATNNLLLVMAKNCGNRPGANISISFSAPGLSPSVGVPESEDVAWLVDNLRALGYVKGQRYSMLFDGSLTGTGWIKVAELRRTEESSRFAFYPSNCSSWPG